MDNRQTSINQLRDLRKKVVSVNDLTTKLQMLNQKLSMSEDTIREQNKILGGSFNEEWDEVHPVGNAERLQSQFEKAGVARASRIRTTIYLISVLLNIAVFALSIFYLVKQPANSWIKTFDERYIFWITHVILGLALTFAPWFFAV